MNPHGNGKNEPPDPEQVLRLVEIELAQQRAARRRAGSPYRAFRLASFIFLFAVLIGVALAFYYVFVSGGLDEFRSRNQPKATPTPSSHAP
ncbi:MAG: hypothetical protein M3N48_12585 [Verrucomicrobiota bacterium]|nr:hypothetical protein [Verrucomicrobiota bacterium]